MPGLILWKNEEINKLKRDMDRLFSRMWDDFGIRISPSNLGAILDMSESDDALMVQVELPGIDPADLDVTVSEDTLTIKWNTWEEMFEERRQRYFTRSFRLPCRIEYAKVEATYNKSGVLSIVLPKCRIEPPREVKIRVQQE
jgi:HSP20 family protein